MIDLKMQELLNKLTPTNEAGVSMQMSDLLSKYSFPQQAEAVMSPQSGYDTKYDVNFKNSNPNTLMAAPYFVGPTPMDLTNTSSFSATGDTNNKIQNNTDITPGGGNNSTDLKMKADAINTAMGNPTNYSNPDSFGVFKQMVTDRALNRGLYALEKGVQYSPEELNSRLNAADSFYTNHISQLTEKEKAAKTKAATFGVDSVLSGLSSNAANMIYKIGQDFNESPTVKEFNTLQGAVLKANDIVNRINKTGGVAGDDMSLMVLLAKAQDPTTGVKEGEFNSIGDFYSNLPQKAKSFFSSFYKATPEGRLTPEARKKLISELNSLYNGNKEQYDNFKKFQAGKIRDISGKEELGDVFLGGYENAYKPIQTTGNTSSGTVNNTGTLQGGNPMWNF
jgi:hypothetical protein